MTTAAFETSHLQAPQVRTSFLARLTETLRLARQARAEREIARYGYLMRKYNLAETTDGLDAFPSATQALPFTR